MTCSSCQFSHPAGPEAPARSVRHVHFPSPLRLSSYPNIRTSLSGHQCMRYAYTTLLRHSPTRPLPIRSLSSRAMSTDEIVATLYARPLPPLEPKAPWNADLKARIAKLDEHRYVVAGESSQPSLFFRPHSPHSSLSSLSPPHLHTPRPSSLCHDLASSLSHDLASSLSHDLASSLSAAISPAAELAALDLAPLGRSLTHAALHLANDDIYACHDIAQASEGDPTADLMHATLHRREGDYWNSK